MISKSEAKKAAHSYLNSRSDLKRDFTLVIVDEYTIEKEYGYIFFTILVITLRQETFNMHLQVMLLF